MRKREKNLRKKKINNMKIILIKDLLPDPEAVYLWCVEKRVELHEPKDAKTDKYETFEIHMNAETKRKFIKQFPNIKL